MSEGTIIREAVVTDCKEIARLIQELADFEKMPDGPKLSVEDLERDGFKLEPPHFRCFVLQESLSSSELIGYALFYTTYSTWTGKCMLLEDIYLSPVARARKLGSLLFRAVAKEAVRLDCSRMDLQVLKWNPARKFYENHGAIDMTEKEDWLYYRVPRDALEKLN